MLVVEKIRKEGFKKDASRCQRKNSTAESLDVEIKKPNSGAACVSVQSWYVNKMLESLRPTKSGKQVDGLQWENTYNWLKKFSRMD